MTEKDTSKVEIRTPLGRFSIGMGLFARIVVGLRSAPENTTNKIMAKEIGVRSMLVEGVRQTLQQRAEAKRVRWLGTDSKDAIDES